MKELSIEEKAKAYDEALKVLHKYDGANIMFSQSLKEEMFPELKESEDERIRKELIAYCQVNMGHTWHNIKQEDYIAWLKKQGKKKSTKWSEEDENISNKIIDYMKPMPIFFESTKGESGEEYTKEFIKESINWLKSLKDRVQPQPRQKWSEEDEKHLKLAIDNFQTLGNSFLTAWLKSLKDRAFPQQQEWSEEDETRLNSTIKHLEEHEGDTPSPLKPYIWEDINWLKSLRPHNRWKPSESDILLLERIVNGKSDPQDFQASLYGLIENLKKLK